MGRVLLLAPLLLLGLALADSSPAAALFRCGGGIASPNDSLERVAAICGAPDERAEWEIVRRQCVRRGDHFETITTVIHMERWVFDFGPERLVQALTFADGSLVRIDSQGYGTPRRRDLRSARRADREWVLVPTVADRLRRID